MSEESEYDTTEKVEETEHGFRLSVTSTRGTGTRDQDKVSMTAKTETYPDATVREKVCRDVIDAMNTVRQNQPDAEEEE